MKKRLVISALAIFFMAGILIPFAKSADVPRMTKEELKAMLGNPDLVIIDVRREADWTGSDSKIKGAVREDPGAIKGWATKYPKDKTLVLYCA
jgi:3-mercaptopyruvate sulfurtransferase SseA